MRIFIASYTYIYEHNHRIFDYFKNKSNLFLVVPKKWRSTKGNKKTVYPPRINNVKVVSTPACFYHSKYPVIRGQLKGWMPMLWFLLKKESKPGDVFFSAYEPNLFVTYIYGLIAKSLKLKHIFFTWQNVPYRERMSGLKLKLTEWLLKRNIELSTAGICGMQKAYEVHKDYFEKYNPALKTAVFNQAGVDTDVFKPEAKNDFREKHNLTDKKVVIYSATFTPRKGTLQTLEAFKMLHREMPEAHLVIVGTGELESQVKRIIDNPDMRNSVTLLPWQPINELAPMYAQSDVMVHPSVPFDGWEEQWGLLMLQAQACGTPVVTSKTGSLEETVLDGKTGILVEQSDPEPIYRAMKKILSDDALRYAMGKAGREYITGHFSYHSTAEKMEKFLNSL
ncbi:MAG: glycosyltransferase family 4 protein [Candidatus Yanofskybacteria bacterium]|nr:glycosyltransferase family 4 protein [Candidatus Yanofskybacteria bacterium]